MNLVQLIRRSRQGVDALLPMSGASSMWPDEEMVDLVNEAYESTLRRFRLVHGKWGLTTLNVDSTPFTREGETYTPSSSLVISSTQQKLLLPPDFAELIRIKCTNDRSVRVLPAQAETYHWLDLEQSGYDDLNQPLASQPRGMVFYYDIVDQRTLFLTPPVSGTYNLEIDYVPMKRPLYYSNSGEITVTSLTTTINGANTKWLDDNIYTATSGQSAELIVGTSDPQSNLIRVDKDYPVVASITSNTGATLANVWGTASVISTPAILTMAPVLPREYHRWIARITSSLMLSKVNPELADKYVARFMNQFSENIAPTIKRRQSQDSRVVEDAEEFAE